MRSIFKISDLRLEIKEVATNVAIILNSLILNPTSATGRSI